MSVDVTVPQMGESITEGILATWLVDDGQWVQDGDALFELETDKISTEVPAPANGVVSRSIAAGETIEIGSVVAHIDTDAVPPTASDDAEDNVSEPVTSSIQTIKQVEDRSVATPAARALLQEHKLSPDAMNGSGPHGHITKGDVLAFLGDRTRPEPNRSESEPEAPPAAAVETSTSTPTAAPGEIREKMSPLRQRIATRLVQAQHIAAILTTFNEIDMSACTALRARFKQRFQDTHGVNLGFMSFFATAVAHALARYPLVGARIEGKEIVRTEHVHLGIAVGTDKGLMVPVLRNAQQLDFAGIEGGIRELAGRARDGKLGIADLEGGTFTITNGGVYGSLLSTPILNPPQSGILGMHAIQDRPIAVDGQVVIRPMMYVALSYDHRIVDGAEAVGFLIRIKELIEEPERLLLGL
jgi:2-oxoglutarate dehydrogenase E2 component (dihydrolipoamide succinyltransferase)